MIKTLWGSLSLLLLFCTSVAATTFLPPPSAQINAATMASWQQSYQQKQPQMLKLLGEDHNEGPDYLNGLIEQNSPYLLRHATNPINWQAWSKAAFAEAKAANKLVFLSIGYSTCHWCHVMEQDSFVKTDIAQLLNQDFIALKVDRESLPAVDELYTSALTQVTGSSGWPITAVLNHLGEPVFINAFVTHDKLKILLSRLAKMWQSNGKYLNQNAANVMSLVRKAQALDNSGNVQWTEQTLIKTRDKAMALLDEQHGGFAGSPKFPAEGMLLFMLDQLSRESNLPLKQLIATGLDQMAGKGMYDHIHGGFHRYSTDKQWLVPHYEKMLYNQGQLLLVYAKAARMYDNPRYAQVLKQTIAFMRQWLYLPGQGLASAIDADFNAQDGAFYLRSQAQLQQVSTPLKQQAQMQTYQFEHSPRYGVYFNRPDSKAAKIIAKQLAAQIDTKPHIDVKVITAWNGLAIWGLVESYQLLKDESIKQLALTLGETLWHNHFAQTRQGPVLYRDSFAGQLNGMGTLQDYVFLAKAFMGLFDISGEQRWLKQAQLLIDVVNGQFAQPNGGYSLSDSRSSQPLAVSMSQTKDTEVLPAGVVMVELLQDLWHRHGQMKDKKLMKAAANGLKHRINNDGLNHLYAAKVVANISGKVNGSLQYFAAGKGRVELVKLNDDKNYQLVFAMQPGWHINSNAPLQKYLRPTKVTFAPQQNNYQVNYPAGQTVRLGFQKEPLSVYEHQFKLDIEVNDKAADKRFSVDVQACSDSVCLMPQKLQFNL